MKLLADAVQPVFGDAHVKSATLDGLSASITLSLAPEPKSVKDDFATACAAYAQPASAGHSATGVVRLERPTAAAPPAARCNSTTGPPWRTAPTPSRRADGGDGDCNSCDLEHLNPSSNGRPKARLGP